MDKKEKTIHCDINSFYTIIHVHATLNRIVQLIDHLIEQAPISMLEILHF
jgi:hypothetical protein